MTQSGHFAPLFAFEGLDLGPTRPTKDYVAKIKDRSFPGTAVFLWCSKCDRCLC